MQPKIVYRGTSLGWICTATEMVHKVNAVVRGINLNDSVYSEEKLSTVVTKVYEIVSKF